MRFGKYEISENKVIMRIKNRVCETPEELFLSDMFYSILKNCLKELKKHDSYLLGIFKNNKFSEKDITVLKKTFLFLTKMNSDLVPNVVIGSKIFFKDKALLNEFVEYLYNYWRSYDRFLISESQEEGENRAYRIFNNTIEQLTHLVRSIYRDVQENITNTHPSIYRQLRAGAEVAAIAVPKKIPFKNNDYKKLNKIHLVRQILLYPPLILNPPMNKRTGMFERITKNPLKNFIFDEKDWLCYPAKVGKLLILVYFHKKFSELGFSLCNLFEIAQDDLAFSKPDAVYLFGIDKECIENFGESYTVFYDDTESDMLVAAVPNDDVYGYFGYLKKMILTLHNIIMMKKGFLPFHGALVNIMLPKKKNATILFIGDTGAGKSETLEALRDLGKNEIQDMVIIADDMGSLEINKNNKIIGYGTEIGAFLRLDDLKPGYAFGQIDRAIIMSPSQINARIVLPVSTYQRVISGQKIDFIFYANNYEEIDENHKIIEKVESCEQALKIFREGTVMSKGTTTTTGLVHSYFANIFGPPQYKEEHEKLAQKYFKIFFNSGIYVGQMRTRLGIPGYERQGPKEAAAELLKLIKNQKIK